jgi:hypothetical protein
MLKRTLFAVMSLAILLGVSSTASAQKTKVIRVVIVKTDDSAACAQALESGKAIMKKLGLLTNIHASMTAKRARRLGRPPSEGSRCTDGSKVPATTADRRR